MSTRTGGAVGCACALARCSGCGSGCGRSCSSGCNSSGCSCTGSGAHLGIPHGCRLEARLSLRMRTRLGRSTSARVRALCRAGHASPGSGQRIAASQHRRAQRARARARARSAAQRTDRRLPHSSANPRGVGVSFRGRACAMLSEGSPGRSGPCAPRAPDTARSAGTKTDGHRRAPRARPLLTVIQIRVQSTHHYTLNLAPAPLERRWG